MDHIQANPIHGEKTHGIGRKRNMIINLEVISLAIHLVGQNPFMDTIFVFVAYIVNTLSRRQKSCLCNTSNSPHCLGEHINCSKSPLLFNKTNDFEIHRLRTFQMTLQENSYSSMGLTRVTDPSVSLTHKLINEQKPRPNYVKA